jgi:hypothetical protein
MKEKSMIEVWAEARAAFDVFIAEVVRMTVDRWRRFAAAIKRL